MKDLWQTLKSDVVETVSTGLKPNSWKLLTSGNDHSDEPGDYPRGHSSIKKKLIEKRRDLLVERGKAKMFNQEMKSGVEFSENYTLPFFITSIFLWERDS